MIYSYLTCNHKRNEQEKICGKVEKDHHYCLPKIFLYSTITIVSLKTDHHRFLYSTFVKYFPEINQSYNGYLVQNQAFEKLPELSSQSKNASGKFKTSATCCSWLPQLATLKSPLSFCFTRKMTRPMRREHPMRTKKAARRERTVYSVNLLMLTLMKSKCV